MFRREGGDCDICVFVDHPWLDFVGVHFPASPDNTLVSLRIRTCIDVNAIGLQDVLGHRVQSSRTIYFEWGAPTGSPSGEDQIRVASGMIGMEVRHKSYFQVGRFEGRDAPVEKSSLGATHDARSEIDKIGTIANNDGGRRTGTVRIGDRRASAKEH